MYFLYNTFLCGSEIIEVHLSGFQGNYPQRCVAEKADLQPFRLCNIFCPSVTTPTFADKHGSQLVKHHQHELYNTFENKNARLFEKTINNTGIQNSFS